MEKLDIRSSSTAPAVVTAIRALDALTNLQGHATLDELTRALDEPRSSVHRILNTLVEGDLLQKPGQRGGYRMGPKVITWGSTFLRAVNLIDEFRIVAAPVVARVDETMQLAVLDWPDVVFVAFLDSQRPVRLATEVGRRLPAHATAAGKALLAFSGMSLADTYRHLEMRRLTQKTVTSVARAGPSARQGSASRLGRSVPRGIGESDVPRRTGSWPRRPHRGCDDRLCTRTLPQAVVPARARP